MSALYIHIPFCEKKCLYCSFVVSIGQEERRDDYLACIEKEAAAYQGEQIETVYLGGGTPTYLTEPQLEKLFSIIRRCFDIKETAEITIEGNPEGLELAKAKSLRSLGVNRISLGVQSLQDKYLKYLGRIHDSKKAVHTFHVLRQAGFDNINVDLMYGFPGQTQSELEQDLKDITALGSEHISLYTLTIEEPSRFYTTQVKLDSSELLAERYCLVKERIEQAGFAQYEISNFAKTGYESKHNMNYWLGGDYIGLGVGAHSHKSGRRFWNVPNTFHYMDHVKRGSSVQDGFEVLTSKERAEERFLLGLRTKAGVAINDLEQELQYSFGSILHKKIHDFIKEGFLQKENGHIQATAKGQLVLDTISAELYDA